MRRVLIFIEARDKNKPEASFLRAIFKDLGLDSEKYDLICTDGYTNLLSEKSAFVNKMQANTDEGGKNIVIFDADYEYNDGGFQTRKNELLKKGAERRVSFDMFLWPTNSEDGDVELLMERIARKDLYPEFFDCFKKYEMCVSARLKPDNTSFYDTPNRKGKLHTYLNALPISKSKKDRIGGGEWLFDDSNIWDINSECLQPIKDFLVNTFNND